MVLKNHYKTLEIPASASKAEVTSSFRRLAKRWHPDVNTEQNTSEKFCEIYEAYEILSDNTKRGIYDSLLVKKSYRNENQFSKAPTSDLVNKQYVYQTWEQEAHLRAKEYSKQNFSDFTLKLKSIFTPKLRLNGWFENIILPHLVLFAFFPAGLYMVWVSNILPRLYKKAITTLTAFIFLFYIYLLFISK